MSEADELENILHDTPYWKARAEAAEAKLAEQQWQPIETLPDSNDLVWLRRRGNEIKGPCDPHETHQGFVAHDGWDEWALCEPPS